MCEQMHVQAADFKRAHAPLRAGRWRVAFVTCVCGTLKGTLRPRSSTEKHVCLQGLRV